MTFICLFDFFIQADLMLLSHAGVCSPIFVAIISGPHGSDEGDVSDAAGLGRFGPFRIRGMIIGEERGKLLAMCEGYQLTGCVRLRD